ncbi:hypothetical protein OROHE_021493 [Orobanche hederae]
MENISHLLRRRPSYPEAYCLHNIGGIIWLGQFQATLVCQIIGRSAIE